MLELQGSEMRLSFANIFEVRLDRTLFWTTADLDNKLLEFRDYFNNHRTHHSLEG